MPAAQQKVATSRGSVAAALAAAKSASRRATTARTAYDKVVDRFDQAQDRVDDARDRVDEIATASYMGGNFARLNVLVDASGPADMMDRLSLVEQLMHSQQQDVDTLVAA